MLGLLLATVERLSTRQAEHATEAFICLYPAKR